MSQYPADERASRAALLALLSGTAFWGASPGGSTNAFTVTINNTGWASTAGAIVAFIAPSTNTSASPTLTVNGGTPTSIVSQNGLGINANGAILSGSLYFCQFDGTWWRLLNPSPGRSSASLTSGLTKDLAVVHPGAKRIVLAFEAVSFNAATGLVLQLGDAGGIETSGYAGAVSETTSSSTTITANSDHFKLATSVLQAANTIDGGVVLTRMSNTAHTWALHGVLMAGSKTYSAAGTKTTSLALSTIRLTSASGTAAFDAGQVYVTVE